jgi:uncharacterized protein YndB with AHSA1/START domain
MSATTSENAAPADRVLVLERLLDAPRALLFKVWTRPEHIVRWWGPRGFALASCEMDPREGGAYRFCMRQQGGKDLWLHGVYREVRPPERLSFSFVWEREDGTNEHETLVTVTFAEEGARTRLTLHQAIFESVESRDSHEGGWSESLDMLAEYLAETARP